MYYCPLPFCPLFSPYRASSSFIAGFIPFPHFAPALATFPSALLHPESLETWKEGFKTGPVRNHQSIATPSLS
jgi:hypothetical protein